MTALLSPRACGDALALLGVEHDAGVVVEERVVVVERAGVLRERVEQRGRATTTPCRTSSGEWAAAMTSGRAACTCEWIANGGLVDRAVALDDLAVVVDEDQVGDADVA